MATSLRQKFLLDGSVYFVFLTLALTGKGPRAREPSGPQENLLHGDENSDTFPNHLISRGRPSGRRTEQRTVSPSLTQKNFSKVDGLASSTVWPQGTQYS